MTHPVCDHRWLLVEDSISDASIDDQTAIRVWWIVARVSQTTFSLDRANFAVLLIALNWRDEEQWRLYLDGEASLSMNGESVEFVEQEPFTSSLGLSRLFG